MTSAGGLAPATEALVERRRRTFGPTSMLFYKRPLHVVRAEGVWLYEADGTRFLDAYNNVPSVGHCHPAVVTAISRQLGTLNTHTRYLYDVIYTYAERLLATMPAELSNIVFTCTGSESADLAMRVAQAVTGRTGFIVTANAYHGNTTAVTGISPSSASAEPRSPNVVLVPAPDTYRGGAEGLGQRFAASVEHAIAAMEARGIRLAAFVADSIFSSDGVFPGDSGFLAETAAAVQRAGGLYIADEVQPGFGRTGERMWGFARHGLVPDMVVMGKPMGNGYPMGGVAIKPALLQSFGSRAGYFNTFGGSPVAAAAGLAVLETIESEGLQQNALLTGDYLLAGLKSHAAECDWVGDVRGRGLYVGVEFVMSRATRVPNQKAAEHVVNAMRERNVLIGTAGLHGNILKIRPPLSFRREHADILLEAFKASLTFEA
ncbi:MAG: aminotransferase class III-fold pyridoxal phosphate-dependent enzyme [Hyphomicrobium sp.]